MRRASLVQAERYTTRDIGQVVKQGRAVGAARWRRSALTIRSLSVAMTTRRRLARHRGRHPSIADHRRVSLLMTDAAAPQNRA